MRKLVLGLCLVMTAMVGRGQCSAAFTEYNDTICGTHTFYVDINLGGVDSVHYDINWGTASSTAGTLLADDSFGITYWYLTPGTYTPHITLSGDCSLVVYDTVHVMPHVNVPGCCATSYCGNPVTLTASGGSDFHWTPSATLSDSVGPTVIALPTTTTTYTVYGTNGGCYSSDFIVVSPMTLDIDIVGDSVICAGDTAILDVAGLWGATYTYFWDGPAGTFASATTSTLLAYPVTTSTYSVTVTNSFGCTDTDTFTISYGTVAPTLASPLDFCQFEIASVSSAGDSFLWFTAPTGGMPLTPTPTAIGTDTVGTQTFWISQVIGGCESPRVELDAAVHSPSLSLFTIPGILPYSGDSAIILCLTDTAHINLSGADTYAWTTDSITWYPTFWGLTPYPTVTTIYTITGTDLFGCSDTVDVTVAVMTVAPPVVTSPALYCQGDLATQLMPADAAHYWYMTMTGGLPLSTAPTPLTSIPGTITYWVDSSNGFCLSSRVAVDVVVNSLPSVSIFAADTTACPGAVMGMSATGAISYNWSPGTSFDDSLSSSPFAFIDTTVLLTVTGISAAGCSASASITITALTDCDLVWPGDANYDLTANNTDILEIGLGYGLSGSARSGASLSWTGQYSADWTDTLPDGINGKHLDCDGNGLVDDADTTAVSLNYGLFHPKQVHHAQNKATGLPDLYFESGPFAPGDSIAIYLADAVLPLNNVYGIAASVHVAGPAPLYQPWISFPTDSWLGLDNELLKFQKSIDIAHADLTLCRKAHTTASGGGVIGYLHLDAVNPSTDTFTIYFSDVRIIDSAGQIITGYNLLDDTITFIPEKINDIQLVRDLAVVPNPSQQSAQLNFYLGQSASCQVTVTDISGKIIWQSSLQKDQGRQQISLPTNMDAGVYFVSLSAGDGRSRAVKWVKL